ncbi:MAG: ComEA family DNA-binding protein [Actinomycetota bacterium]
MERSWIAAGAVALVALAAAVLLWPDPTTPPPIEIVAARPPDATITVHVSGAVARPGLVSLPADARVADAVLAAGGALPGAVLSGLNLAAPLADGEQLIVPLIDPWGGATSVGDGKVHVNTADVVALQDLPGVGPVLAQRIVDYRNEFGPFTVIEDLLDVPGIGEAKLAALRDVVMVP